MEECNLLGKYNEDYIKGLNLFKSLCKEYKINFRDYGLSWILKFNFLLSEKDACYNFWYNVKEQRRFTNVLYCKNYNDILYTDNCLFTWSETEQGHYYWESLLHRIWKKWTNTTEDTYNSPTLEVKKKMSETLL